MVIKYKQGKCTKKTTGVCILLKKKEREREERSKEALEATNSIKIIIKYINSAM